MRPIATITVTPYLPPELQDLEDLVYNLRWSWDPDTLELLRRIDADLWEEVYHNPVRMLGCVDQTRLRQLAGDREFLAHLRRASRSLHAYMDGSTWFEQTCGAGQGLRVAYFSAEFGLTESLPIYSGGLGVLAGDHLKSASDLGLPLVGVGLFYQQGYFSQYLNNDGWQQEDYPQNDFHTMAARPVRDGDDNEVRVRLSYPEGEALIKIWKIQVGRVPLFLLDTNLEENHAHIRSITGQLYGGDEETRIRQEFLIGVGGLRSLDVLGLRPTVCHMNEGYSAFLALERVRQAMAEQGMDFAGARELVTGANVFTTHTPVPAGHDVFAPDLVERYFKPFAGDLSLAIDDLLDLGREHPGNSHEGLNMTVLALRLCALRNGVSKLHGEVSRRMWQFLWPGLPEAEIPIASISNGIHPASWISPDMRALQDRCAGPRREEQSRDQPLWQGAEHVPGEELWRVHERGRERLVDFVRSRMQRQLRRRGASPREIGRGAGILDPRALTIGFARRFATYKRATLLLRDPDRLGRILCDPRGPVQIIFAGKAHPHDNYGKELIREIVHLSQREDLHDRVVFLEDYDICAARFLVQGCDVWLNTPMRPLEASGTSGMKAVANGALHLSVLDGWWAEAYSIDGGWAIGQGEEYEDQAGQDQVESDALYRILEQEVVPLFYDRDGCDFPMNWVARMKSAMRTLCPHFNTHRMVSEYTERFYLAAHRRWGRLGADGGAPVRELAAWKTRVQDAWEQVKIARVEADDVPSLRVGEELEVRAWLALGPLSPDEVAVELYHGLVDTSGEIVGGEASPMTSSAAQENGTHLFSGRLPCEASGRRGYTVRVMPFHRELGAPCESRLIAWAGG